MLSNKKSVASALGAAVFIGCLASLFSGCASPTTGWVRDSHLLYNRGVNPEITSVEKFGPFYERVTTAGGSNERVSYRPLLYTRIASEREDAALREILWPVYTQHSRGDSLTWRFLIFGGTDFDTADEASRYRTWLFPLWFQGRTKDDMDYAALFPIYGTIREMWFDRISFTLFPVWLEYDKGDAKTWSVLWPIVSRTQGGGFDKFRVWPFYGYAEREGRERSRFVLWPFWTQAEYSEINPGRAWMLFPVVGRVDRANESRWMALPPFFSYARGREDGKTPYYRRINAPWPLVHILDERDHHKRNFWPFYGHQYNDDGTYDSRWVLWPFFRTRDVEHKQTRETTRTLFPVYYRSVLRLDADKDGGHETLTEDFMRVWPLYSRRADPQNSFVKIPDVSFFKRTGAPDRNLLGMFTLYTRGSTENPRKVDHEALWGMFRRGYGDEDYSVWRVWPFYSSRQERGERAWSVLGGLIGRESGKLRYLWFFGGGGAADAEDAATRAPSKETLQ